MLKQFYRQICMNFKISNLNRSKQNKNLKGKNILDPNPCPYPNQKLIQRVLNSGTHMAQLVEPRPLFL